jgi:hypothetical protein
MYQPRKDSRRERMLQIVNESGGITAEHIAKTYGTMGFLNVWAITSELRKLARFKCINQIGNVFFSVEQEKPAYKAEPKNLVPPREAVPFTPLKTFPPTISPRGQPIERRQFKNCRSNVRFQRENEI